MTVRASKEVVRKQPSLRTVQIYQINDAEKNREYRCRSYAYQIEHGFMITTDNYEISYCAKASQGLFPAKIRENMESLNPDKFKIRKFGVSDVIAITAAGKTAFYYVDKEALVKFNGFLAPKAEGSYLILNEGGYQIEGQTDTWKVIDEKNVQEQRFVQLVCEQTKKQKPDIVLHDSGVLVAQTIYGFDSSVMKKIEKFLREQKPELLHHIYCYVENADQSYIKNGSMLDSTTGDETGRTQEDLEANAFAGLLLMPDQLLHEQILLYGLDKDLVTVDSVLMLMDMFAMPYKAVVLRLFESGNISHQQAEKLLEAGSADVMERVSLTGKAKRWQLDGKGTESFGTLLEKVEYNRQHEYLTESREKEDVAYLTQLKKEYGLD